ncbi:hypothetical protein J4E81_006397 [Alternaria sp. BMP 2799]|nr:hypothetical protein J4E81_006397 [Alternaria sp. BMP 2799]
MHSNESAPYAVAVKTFRKGTNVAADVRREVDALARMNQLEEDHIVLFMTSFQGGTQESPEYYVLFEWADGGNLSDFWKHYDLDRTASLMKWVMEQLCGLAKALSRAHNLENGASYRHGDIKPGNILWFRGSAESGEYGILKIGDWGEAKIHEDITALRHGDTTAKYGSRRYEPPETGLQSLLPEGSRHVRSRLYDVWGMGCIMLEFTIWLLYGLEELSTFNKSNLGHFGISYMFYEISGERAVKIHRAVERWMKHMANDPSCSPGVTALGDLLQIVRTGLLVVKLPKDVDPKPQADVELPPNKDNDSPLISVTKPNSTSSVANHAPIEQGTRFRATDLERSLRRITENGSAERYWRRDQNPRPPPVETAGSADLLAPPTRRKSHATGLRVSPHEVTDYAHPSLDPEEWEFVPDNEFVTKLSSQLRNATNVVSPEAPLSAQSCDVCKDLEARLPDTDFAITYETQTLRQNAQDERCNLCRLIWQTCGDKIRGQSERVQFQRMGSTLRMTGTKQPVLTVLRSDGKPPL